MHVETSFLSFIEEYPKQPRDRMNARYQHSTQQRSSMQWIFRFLDSPVFHALKLRLYTSLKKVAETARDTKKAQYHRLTLQHSSIRCFQYMEYMEYIWNMEYTFGYREG